MWLYKGKPFSEDDVGDYYGFVYEITDDLTGRKYIGKKFFTKAGSKQVKGKRRKVRKVSDWEKYWGSCKELVDLVTERGEGNFTREILRLCKTRGETSYQEAKLQFARNVLETTLPDGSPMYYNGIINVRIGRRAIGNTEV
jgi:hypothetical protein